MQKYILNLRKSLLSEEFITQARLFMRFHLTKSSGGTLGVRSSIYNGYQWDEIMSAMSDVLLCGGDCVEDVNVDFDHVFVKTKKPMRSIRTSKLTATSLASFQ